MPISFKGFAQFSALTSLPPGTLITFDQDGTTLIGVIVDYDKPKYIVQDLLGGRRELIAERLHKLPNAPEIEKLASTEQKLEALNAVLLNATEISSQIDLEKLWKEVHSNQIEYDNSTLCQKYCGADNLLEHLALRIALGKDRLFFKRKKDRFTPRTFENVEEMRQVEAQQKLHQQLEQKALQYILARLNGESGTFPEECRLVMQALEEIAVDAPHTENARKRRAKELLQLIFDQSKVNLVGALPDRAWQLLERIGWFNALTNAALLRHRPQLSFSVEALDQAQKIASNPESFNAYTELERKLIEPDWCVSIDDASTKDADDAISLNQTQNGITLGVHITDIASFITPNSKLDLEAKKRATSIYLPEMNINMFPELICEDLLSLQPGKRRACLSFIFDIDHSSRVKSFRIQSGWVSIQQRLSYEQVDQHLEHGTDPQLSRLYEIAFGLEADRFADGGFRVNKREVGVGIGKDHKLSIFELDEAAPGRSLIAELMVLTNRALADFAVEHKFPLIFRGQRDPDPSQLRLDSIPEGPARDFALRSKLQRSVSSVEPSKHATLGLRAYTQATSPLRRYVDLVNQRQLLSFLHKGRAHYSHSELRKIMSEVEAPLKHALGLTREVRRFWLIKYLEANYKLRDRLSGTVVRCDKASPMVELDMIYIIVIARSDKAVKLGDKVQLEIADIDSRYDILKLEVVG